jgi:cold shock CspA family protein
MRLKGVIKLGTMSAALASSSRCEAERRSFFHITACSRDAGRPQVSQRVLFDVELGSQGKPRAQNIELIRFAPYRSNQALRNLRHQSGAATLYAIPAFLIVYLAVTLS